MQDRHFIVEGRFGSSKARQACVTIRMSGSQPIVEVRPHRSREVYSRPLADIAQSIVERGLAGGDPILKPKRGGR